LALHPQKTPPPTPSHTFNPVIHLSSLELFSILAITHPQTQFCQRLPSPSRKPMSSRSPGDEPPSNLVLNRHRPGGFRFVFLPRCGNKPPYVLTRLYMYFFLLLMLRFMVWPFASLRLPTTMDSHQTIDSFPVAKEEEKEAGS